MENNTLKSRNYTFTINNYEDNDLVRFHELSVSLEKHHYICYGLEIAPTTNTRHIQGYIQLNTAQRYSFLQNYFNFQRDGQPLKFHIEIANGTPLQNKKYCQKDGDFYEFGEPITQGTRTDLLEIKRSIIANPKDIKGIVHEFGNSPQQIRYAEILQPYYLMPRDPNLPPKVYWIFGKSGVGKMQGTPFLRQQF